jgi:glycosyltransferase involved in cell wall biosynthesis/GT2 family glycosyltransferase
MVANFAHNPVGKFGNSPYNTIAMSSPPPISVVIPCYNDGRFLRRCLQTVWNQTLRPDQVLVVNDGSTEKTTLKILRNLATSVTIIDQENRGLAAARNAGIRNARGKYIYFLDADDEIAPECLAKLSALLEDHEDALAAASKVRLVGGPNHGAVWGRPLNRYMIRTQNQWGAGIMLRKAAVEKNNLWYDETMRQGYEDWELHMRLAKASGTVLFCPEPLYHYRIRRKSLLSETRKRHLEVVQYIQTKHNRDYALGNLLQTKRHCAPALIVGCCATERADLERCLSGQTFRDWSWDDNPAACEARYYLHYPETAALRRLPAEALECALMALERYPQPSHCVLAVRQGCPPLFATPTDTNAVEGNRYPVAVVTREPWDRDRTAVERALGACELLIEFIDQEPTASESWNQSMLRLAPNSLMTGFAGPESLRKSLRLFGRHVFGDAFQRGCIGFYDHIYYRMLCSDQALALRKTIRRSLGTRVEKSLSSFAYGLFLASPPDPANENHADIHLHQNDKLSPFFSTPTDGRIHILIATAWLVEGGVEQIIFEICRLLDPCRFRVTIVTTLASQHSWDAFARRVGAAVYHMADFLKPADMVRGFVHLVLNHHVDCMFIMNSEAAYRAARTLKTILPWLPIIDRVEAADPGGGYPMISAKVGKDSIDVRTVSHRKLAETMATQYGLTPEGVRVIYIGSNAAKIVELADRGAGALHERCNLSRTTPLVVFVGRFAAQKRPDIFVRSAVKVLQTNPGCEAHFAMIGDGYLRPAISALIAELQLDSRIHLLGAHANAVEFMRDATVLMMPSAYEGLALVSYEAMALGIPQIFANVNGQAELITPETGILIDNGPGEETRYAKACLELLSDPDRRARMAAAGKERIRNNFTAENAVKQYAEIFEQMAEISRKRAAEIPHLRPPHINPLHELY